MNKAPAVLKVLNDYICKRCEGWSGKIHSFGNQLKKFEFVNDTWPLCHRANILEKNYNGTKVFVYEDHRTIVNVLFYLQETGRLKKPTKLIRFDYHADHAHPRKAAFERIGEFRNSPPNFRQIWDFTEFELDFLDNDWLIACMELGIVNDEVLFHCREGNDRSDIDGKGIYRDSQGMEHKLFDLGFTWEALGPRSPLGDIMKSDEYKALWRALDWELHRERGEFRFKEDYDPYVLDFDLDFLTTTVYGQTTIVPEEILRKKLGCNEPYSDTPYQFICELIDRAKFITICMESDYCGGLYGAHKAFKMFDEMFFKGKLGNYSPYGM